MSVDYFIRPKKNKPPKELADELYRRRGIEVSSTLPSDGKKHDIDPKEYSLHSRMKIKHHSDVYAVFDAIKAIEGVDDVKMFYDKITDFGT
jgi:hypothetical protein